MNQTINSVAAAPVARANSVRRRVNALRRRRRSPKARRHRNTLYAQVVASNALVVTALIFVDVVLVRNSDATPSFVDELLLVMTAFATTLTLNIVLLSRQFRPLYVLVETMETIDISQPGAHAEIPEHTTEDIAELFETFNEMIARVEHERQRRAAAAVRAQEGERARVARDLHDEANQALTAVLLRLEAATHNAPPDVAAEIREAKGLAGQAIEELLEVSRKLRPTVLDLGLKNALKALCDRANDAGGIRVALSIAGDTQRLNPERELAVYRIAQESLSNVQQHSRANEVAMRFVADRTVTLEIADDGQGFDPELPTERYGVAGMRERALLAGGTLNIYSEPGVGTTVRLEIR